MTADAWVLQLDADKPLQPTLQQVAELATKGPEDCQNALPQLPPAGDSEAHQRPSAAHRALHETASNCAAQQLAASAVLWAVVCRARWAVPPSSWQRLLCCAGHLLTCCNSAVLSHACCSKPRARLRPCRCRCQQLQQ